GAETARQGGLRPFRIGVPAFSRHQRVHERAERPAEREGMTTKSWLLLLVVSLACAGSTGMLSAADGVPDLSVTPIARDGQVLVSFDLSDGLTSDVRDAIQSGLSTTFAYDLELRRGPAGWFDRTLSAVSITATVRFDNLTRRYQMTRTIDGR